VSDYQSITKIRKLKEKRNEMSNSARSVFAFGLYLVVLGLFLLVAPNVLLGMFALPDATDVWVRVAGMLVLFLGFYYSQAARKNLTDFFQWTVYASSSFSPSL
jgi:uncharacterized protein YjeT (DUF2065 family)